ALVVDDTGRVVLRLRLPYYEVESETVDLTISYAHARLMGITDDEREEIFDPDREVVRVELEGGIPAGEASILADELDASADGRFVHRFALVAVARGVRDRIRRRGHVAACPGSSAGSRSA